MNGPLVLALDVGTQSVRALALDRHGTPHARRQVPLAPPFTVPHPGWAEQDPAVWWQALADAAAAVAREAGPQAIAALALTTQRGSLVAAREDGTPLRPAIVWPDQRLCTRPPPLGPGWSLLFAAGGARGLVHALQRQAEVNWLAEHEPALQADRLVLLSAWLTRRLVGDWVDSAACQVGYLPFDYRRQRWAAPAAWQWRALAIRPSQLPRLVAPGALLGRLTHEAAAACGLPSGLPVVAAAADKACEVLGAGAAAPGVAHLSLGTAAAINATRPAYVEVQRLLPAYPAALPGAFSTEVHVQRGLWLVRWFQETFGVDEAGLEALLAQTPPGACGLVALPHWSPGLRDPGPEARGALVGFGDVHGRAHVYRALIEGLALQLRAGREAIERRTRQPLARLVVSGGGARSDGVVQIAADVFGLAAERPRAADASALGAAMLAAVHLGWWPDAAAAAQAMAGPADRIAPRPDAVALYDRLYADVFRPLAGRLRPLNRRLRTLFGYPP